MISSWWSSSSSSSMQKTGAAKDKFFKFPFLPPFLFGSFSSWPDWTAVVEFNLSVGGGGAGGGLKLFCFSLKLDI